MKNLVTRFVIIASIFVYDISGSVEVESVACAMPDLIELSALDLQALRSSPVEVMSAIKEGSYHYRLWAKVATMQSDKYQDLYNWRVKTFFELIKKHFPETIDLTALQTRCVDDRTDICAKVAEIKTDDKNPLQSPEIKTAEEKIIEECWKVLTTLFNGENKAVSRKVRLFIAENRALLFNKIALLKAQDHELLWLSYMARLETIGLKDEFMILTGALAYESAHALGKEGLDETARFLLAMIETPYFNEYWLGKKSEQVSQSAIWKKLLSPELMGPLEVSLRENSQPPSSFGSIGDGRATVNVRHNLCTATPWGYMSVFAHRNTSSLNPRAPSFYGTNGTFPRMGQQEAPPPYGQ